MGCFGPPPSKEEVEFKRLKGNCNVHLKQLNTIVKRGRYRDGLQELLLITARAFKEIKQFFKEFLDDETIKKLFIEDEVHILRPEVARLREEKRKHETTLSEFKTKDKQHCEELEKEIKKLKKERTETLEKVLQVHNQKIEELHGYVSVCKKENEFLKQNQKPELQNHYDQLQKKYRELEYEITEKKHKQKETREQLEKALKDCEKLNLQIKLLMQETASSAGPIWSTPYQSLTDLQKHNTPSQHMEKKNVKASLDSNAEWNQHFDSNTMEYFQEPPEYMEIDAENTINRKPFEEESQHIANLQKELESKNSIIEKMQVQYAENVFKKELEHKGHIQELETANSALVEERVKQMELLEKCRQDLQNHIELETREQKNIEMQNHYEHVQKNEQSVQENYNQLLIQHQELNAFQEKHTELLKHCEQLKKNEESYLQRIQELELRSQNYTDLEKLNQKLRDLESENTVLQNNCEELEKQNFELKMQNQVKYKKTLEAQSDLMKNLQNRIHSYQGEISNLNQVIKSLEQNSRVQVPDDLQSSVSAPSLDQPSEPEISINQIGLKRIEKINSDINDIAQEIDKFDSNSKKEQYLHLKELLIRCMLQLDDVDSNGDETIRSQRSKSMKTTQVLTNLLESKFSTAQGTT